MRLGQGKLHARLAALGALVLLGSCNSEPTGPELPQLHIVVVRGDGDFGTVGQDVEVEAVVRRASGGTPVKDIAVSWTVQEGDATVLPGASGASDAAGLVRATLRLGQQPGTVLFRVAATQQPSAVADFRITVADRPELTALSTPSAAAGETVSVQGRGFSTDADQNVVLFDGIRARVLSSTATQLDVEVPPCLPNRDVEVTVQLGVLVSEAAQLTVTGGGEGLGLGPGEWVDLPDPAAPLCSGLGGSAGARYLVLAASTGTVGGGRYDFTHRGLSSAGSGLAALRAPSAPPEGSPALRWKEMVRAREAEALHRVSREPTRPARRARVRVPSVGEERTFQVLNRDNEFDEVTAVARHVGSHSVMYVDKTAPTPGLSDADLALLAVQFDDVIHPTVTGAFGEASDLDGNQRIAILFTPTVNRLTARGADGFIGGFFYGVDLLEGQPGSNGGEIFYSVVPDPQGIHSDARTTAMVLQSIPAILAHEFQHMVHFNQRWLVLGEESQEALWLSEGLAQMSEELVARAYVEWGDPAQVEVFRRGNRVRARRYLSDPAAVSLIIATGQGSLAERGAGWLFTLYLADRFGEDALGSLARSARTGVDNVEHVTASSWGELVSDWWSALYLDEFREAPFEFETLSLRELVRDPEGGGFPLMPQRVGETDFLVAGQLWSSSTAYYIVEPPADGSVVLRLAGREGGPAASGSALRMRILRLPGG